LLPRYRFELVHPEVEVRHNEAMVMGPEAGTLAVRIRPRKPSKSDLG